MFFPNIGKAISQSIAGISGLSGVNLASLPTPNYGGGFTMPTTAVPTANNRNSTNIGTFNYRPGTYNADNLPQVTDPDKTFADVSKRQKEFVIGAVRPFERELLNRLDSTELVDQIPQDVEQQQEIAAGVARRDRERFGFERSQALANEQARAVQRGGALNLAGGLNNARLEQDAINRQQLNQLVDFAGGINRSNLSSLGNAANLKTQRDNAYTAARAQSKAQRYGFIGSLFGMI